MRNTAQRVPTVYHLQMKHLTDTLLEHLRDGLLLLLRLIDFQLLSLKQDFVFLITKLKDEASDSLGGVQANSSYNPPNTGQLLKYRKR